MPPPPAFCAFCSKALRLSLSTPALHQNCVRICNRSVPRLHCALPNAIEFSLCAKPDDVDTCHPVLDETCLQFFEVRKRSIIMILAGDLKIQQDLADRKQLADAVAKFNSVTEQSAGS